MTDIATDIGLSVFRDPSVTCYVAQRLSEFATDDGPAEVPYLRLDRLRIAVAPEVDEALFSYEYGYLMREDENAFGILAPLSYQGWFVKVVIEDTAAEDDPDPAVPEPIVWYGVIEIDERQAAGNQPAPQGNSGVPSGTQRLHAYGLLRLLERTPINTSVLRFGDVGGTDTSTIDRGLTFNHDQGGEFAERGNRSAEPDEDGVYVFSDEIRGEDEWTASTAAAYLLKWMAPTDADGNPLCTWKLAGGDDCLDWYDITAATDRRSVKHVLDELINRRRAVSYFVTFDSAYNQATVNVFTFTDQTIEFDSGGELRSNTDQYALNFERALDVATATVRDMLTTKFDKVVAQGDFRTSTFTLAIDRRGTATNNQLIPDWTSDDGAAYNAAASGSAGYSALDPVARTRRNAVVRASDELRHVYSRFTLSATWTQRVYDIDAAPGKTEYFAFPTLKSDGDVAQPYVPGTTDEGETVWTRGVRILRHLPLKDRCDYSGAHIDDEDWDEGLTPQEVPEFRPLLGFVKSDLSAGTWEQIDKLAETSGAYEDRTRRWSAHVRPLERAPSIELRVSGGPQHLFAQLDFSGSEPCDPDHDPNLPDNDPRGLQYSFARITLCAELDSRVAETVEISAPDEGTQQRVLYLQVPNARLDYVAPKTIVGVQDGALQLSDGGFVRDDRERLQAIAKAAAQWYSKTRRAFQLTFRQVRPLIQLGWLITSVGESSGLTEVNTPVTAITYDTENMTCAFETGFAELDFV